MLLSPTDVAVALPALAGTLVSAADGALKERMSQGHSQSETLRRLILQHGLDQIKQLVMLFSFRQKISLRERAKGDKEYYMRSLMHIYIYIYIYYICMLITR